MSNHRTMADDFNERMTGIPKAEGRGPAHTTMADDFREKLNNLPPRPADPRHKTMADQFREDLWVAKNKK